jgi:imidazole glycerol phosphate synthase subunit HisF
MSGGGIHNINVAKNLLDNGIDKIVVATKTTT